MHNKGHSHNFIFGSRWNPTVAVMLTLLFLIFLFLFFTLTAQPAQGQTFTVIHNFTNGGDGGVPSAGLTFVSAGNFYGTTRYGGKVGDFCDWLDETPGCGVVFKLSHTGSGWVLTPIYSFYGSYGDGRSPKSRVAIAADGTLYGTTLAGSGNTDWGTVFHLTPLPTAPRTVLTPWNVRMIYYFTGGSDGRFPQGDLVFGRSRNIYGTAGGNVYELMPSGGSWTQTVLYSNGAVDGVIFDSSGNLYGAFSGGGAFGCGGVFELLPSGSGWTEQTLYNFTGGTDGCNPIGGLIINASENLYGTTSDGGQGGGGTVFELTPGNGSWSFNLLYSFPGFSSPSAKLIMDAAGNLYGTTLYGGVYRWGSVFELQYLNGQWSYRSLHDFTGGSDGASPISSLVLDLNGNLYGTTMMGGTSMACGLSGYIGCGVVFEIMP